jgi:hypothetical protein
MLVYNLLMNAKIYNRFNFLTIIKAHLGDHDPNYPDLIILHAQLPVFQLTTSSTN